MDLSLSLAHTLPTSVQSENLVTAIRKTLDRFCVEELYRDYFSFYNFYKDLFLTVESSRKIQPETVIQCEINAGLWNKAVTSAINSLTNYIHPHYITTQNFIYYLLNENSDADFGLIEEYFCKLLITFPPGPQSFDYYWHIVSEPLLIPNVSNSRSSGLFFWLLDTLEVCLENQENLNSDSTNTKALERKSMETRKQVSLYSEEKILKILDYGVNLNKSNPILGEKEKFSAFCELPSCAKIKNILVTLTFLYNILETDFAFWLNSDSVCQGKRPLLSCLLWKNERDIGLNVEVQKIINLYKRVLQFSPMKFNKLCVVKKLFTLLAEIIRYKDFMEGIKYPFFGTHSENVARQISQVFLQHLQTKKEFPKESLLLSLKPPWLRLLLCSQLLSALTGYQCLPELTGVYDILQNIAHADSCIKNDFKKVKKRKISKNSELIKQLKNYKSVNSKLKNGKTLLHVACEEDNAEKVEALLTFPELDVNATDREGWTALHLAAFKGNSSCVQQLLSFHPKSDAQKPVNTRALGPKSITPLMCAVSEGNSEVCQLLLQHTGSVLLEDFNEHNQTSLELSRDDEVTKILKHYEENYVWTWHSQKNINFDSDMKEIIVRLCVEMIQAYFSTHRTWDVYRCLKKTENIETDSFQLQDSKPRFQWDYLRYQRDLKRNINKLKSLSPKLDKVPEFNPFSYIYVRLLTFNKS